MAEEQPQVPPAPSRIKSLEEQLAELVEADKVTPEKKKQLLEQYHLEVSTAVDVAITTGVQSLKDEIAQLKKENDERARAFEERITASMIDDLTGAYDQGYFYKVALPGLMGHLCSRERRHRDRRSLYPVMVVTDGTRFKTWNDTLGYSTGNRIIACFGKTLKAAIRTGSIVDPADILIRWGGDEFIAILPHAESLIAANIAATRLKEEIHQTDWSFLGLPADGILRPQVDAGAVCLRAKSVQGLVAAGHQPPEGSTVWKIMHGEVEERDGWKNLGSVDLAMAIGLAWFMKAGSLMHDAKEAEASHTYVQYVEYANGELWPIEMEKVEFFQKRNRRGDT